MVAELAGPCALVVVSDNGVGLSGAATGPGHIGLRLLRDTLVDLGGTMEILSPDDGGVEVRATVPLHLAPGLGSVDEGQLDASLSRR